MVGGNRSSHPAFQRQLRDPKAIGSSGRGEYDARWDRTSIAFRKKNPFCRFCEQEGREAQVAEDVDHIVPLRDPFNGDKYRWGNLQSLCRDHHYGLKAKLEHYAQRTGQLDKLKEWCRDPHSRPDMTRRPNGW